MRKKALMKRERQEQDDCIVWLPGSRAASMQQGRRSDDGKQCGNAGSRLENLGAKEKARRKKCKVRFSLIKKNEAFQKNSMSEGGGQEVATSGYGASMVSSCSRDGSYGKVQIEEADGSSSGQQEHDLFVPFHGSVWS